ncbi:hypothetical protein EUX98_g1777 [Antrodiella citrinella]|uniref:RING-type domain-containing protein n=1 Tax=Antrodiella citrinella TaxID=2447956 RepID=A0A4S4N3M4_9APHY|nr:hypothetical protein EUX98_g1777 [Antrodiella citrinella]
MDNNNANIASNDDGNRADAQDNTNNGNISSSRNDPALSRQSIDPAQSDPFADLTSIGMSYFSHSRSTPTPANLAESVCNLLSSLVLTSSLPNQSTPQPGLTASAPAPSAEPASGSSGLSVDVEMADPEEMDLPAMPLPSSSTSTASVASAPAPSASVPPRSTRRTRVEVEEEEEEVRESNRQRIHSPLSENAPPLPLPLPQQQQPNPANHEPHAHNFHVHEAGPHRIILDFVLGPPLPGHNGNNGPPGQPGQPPNAQGAPHFHNAPPGFNMGQFFNQMPGPGLFNMIFGGMGGMGGEEPDDPERAKKLLAGLEEVPIGLVKRLQRVGNGEGDSGPGCAVCWESLLDGDGGFGEDVEAKDGTPADPTTSNDQPTASSSSSPPPMDEDDKKYPKVVALPCSHVFHASCLLPWFTRAHRTTCPSCRFDIDPDSLTYVPRPIRPMRGMPRRNRQQPQPGQAQTPTGAATPGGQPPANAEAAPPQPPAPGVPGAPPGFDYDFFVVDMAGDAEMPSMEPMVNSDDDEDEQDAQVPPPPPHPHLAPAAAAPGAEEQGPPPPYGFFGIDLSFSIVDPNNANAPPDAHGENLGHAHFHMPYVFGGSFPVHGPQPQTANADAANAQQPQPPQPPVFGPAPPPAPGATPQGVPQDFDTEARAFIQQLIGGLFGRAPQAPPPAAPASPSTAPAAPAAPPSESAAPPQSHSNPRATGTGAVPPPPTFAQFFQQVFPGVQIPQGTRGHEAAEAAHRQQPQPAAPHAANPPNPPPPTQSTNAPPTGAANANARTPANMSPQERRAMASMFASLIPGVHFTPTAGQAAGAGPAPAAPAAGAQHMNMVNNNGIDVPVFSFGPAPPPPAGAEDVPPPPPPPTMFDFFTRIPMGGNGRGQRTRAQSQPAHAGGMNDVPPKPQWIIPPPPGPTLRQRIEKRERELGLRCWDISCGLGPTDEDPEPTPGIDVTKVRQIGIHRSGGTEDVCEHKFHSACLVSAERVAGWGGEDEKEEKEGEGGEVEVSCPVCRAVGCVTREEWDEGVIALA